MNQGAKAGWIRPVWVLGLLAGLGSPAFGAGIAIMEQSVKELGQAFSGATTNLDDASAVFFNPGAMGWLRGGRVSVAGHLILPSATFRDGGSRLDPRLGGTPLRGGNGGDGGVTTPVPHFYGVWEPSDRFVLGLGVNSPFGVHSDYDAHWQGRYQALESKITTVNVNPALALRLGETLSVGAGISVQHFYAKLTNAVDFGTICLQALGPAGCAAQGLLPQQADGRVRLEGDSVGVGYNFGLLYAPTPDTRFGVSYRSKLHHTVAGDAEYGVPAAARPLTRTGAFVDTRIHAPVTLPETVAFGFYHRFHPRWAVAADALWTRWSQIEALRVDFASAQPTSNQPLGWEDTWRVALGLNFDWTPVTSFRLGVAYDETPIPDPERRTPRIPDSDRVWLAAGLSVRPFPDLTLHGAYAHLFFADAPIRSVGPTGDRLIGEFRDQLDIVSLQLDWRF
jgi:long-chain fatty acid transport protein